MYAIFVTSSISYSSAQFHTMSQRVRYLETYGVPELHLVVYTSEDFSAVSRFFR